MEFTTEQASRKFSACSHCQYITLDRVVWNDAIGPMPAVAAQREHVGVKVVKQDSVRAGFSLVEMVIVVALIAVLIAIAIPHFLRARDSSRSKACRQNLREFEMVKEQWAINTKALSTATPAPADLVSEYLKGTEDTLPLCPSGGTYSLNDLRSLPTCDIGGNGTPDKWDDHALQ